MVVGGITPFTTIDFPGALAAVLFCQGCPWQCRYCHNSHLQPMTQNSSLSWSSVLDFLRERKGFLEAVVFSGGEPTIHPDLFRAINDVRSLGYRTGLHTNGMFPASLQKILPLIDWVGMDIKAPFDRYETITRVPRSGESARESAQLIIHSTVSHEFRTTVHPHLLTHDDLLKIAHELFEDGAKNFGLQSFREEGCTDKTLANPMPMSWSADFLSQMRALFPSFFIRE